MILDFSEYTHRLAYAQLKNVALTDDSTTGEINPKNEDQILSLVNMGLVDMFTKKKILEGRNILQLQRGVNIYPIKFADMVKVLQVEAVSLNREIKEANKEIFTPKSGIDVTLPSNDSIRFSDDFLMSHHLAVDVVYQKLHPVIGLTDSINMPAHWFELLDLYVAGLYLAHMGGKAHKATGDDYYGLYLTKTAEDTNMNLSGTSEVPNEDTRFEDAGWV